MLTDPKLRSQVDALWDKLWAGGLSNPMDAIEQFSYLLFFKRLDDAENRREKQALRRGQTYKPQMPDEMRWRYWTKLQGAEALKHVREKVFPWFKEMGEGGSSFERYMQNAEFKINRPSLLIEACSAAVQGARGQARPSRIEVRSAEGDLGVNRRDVRRPVDRRVLILSLIDESGRERGLLFHYSCHLTVLGVDNYLISADWLGPVRRRLQSEHGVSRAKNTGLAAVSRNSEWVVFCDADTRLGPYFLHHLNTWLNRHGSEGLSIGTTRVLPQPRDDVYARGWFFLFDLVHRLTKSSFAIQLARTPVARGIGFCEDLNLAEDLLFIQECRRYGRFFFLPTDQVTTSTRRFDANGYLLQSLRWLFEALLPLRLKLHRRYDAIR